MHRGTARGRTEIDIAENELMRRHTTFAIGGPADLFVQPKTRRELTAALAVLRERNIPFLLLGNGSNMLVADAGIRGAVVCTSELDEVRVNEDNTVSAEAGALLSRIARRAQRSGLTGAEFAGGIPGSLGGAVYMQWRVRMTARWPALCRRPSFVERRRQHLYPQGREHGFDYRTSVFLQASGLDGAPFDHAAAERRFGGDSG